MSKNLIQNSSFEYGLAYWDGGSHLSVTASTSYEKSRCLQWEATGSYSNLHYSENHSIPIRVVKNTDYTLSFYYKESGSGVIATVTINKDSVYGASIASKQFSGTSGAWTRLTKSFNTGDNEDIYLRFYDMAFSGTINIDAVQLEIGTSATDYEYTAIHNARLPVDIPSTSFLGLDTYKGVNIPWLKYETGGEVAHDGYGNGFSDYYFNGVNANSTMQNQLNVLSTEGFTFIRLWLNMYVYMNDDKETSGFTEFDSDFLANLATYLDWCDDYGIKVLLCLDDVWHTFPWLWIADEDKSASYILAVTTLVAAIKDKPALWGIDYCNEPYLGWSGDSTSTTRTVNDESTDIGSTRAEVTAFFTQIYNAIKAIAPDLYCSVGESKYEDVRDYNISDCSDFYQYHHYSTTIDGMKTPASLYDKPVVIGEWGYSVNGEYASHIDFNENIMGRFFSLGYNVQLLWSASRILERTGTATYQLKSGVQGYSKFN